ncbi:MAG: hypothetical protein Q8K36_04570, partial [Alphaproteobacteria bacterium]|nr:hypothetical protein [Alphaproteobacteria bacterium]
MNLRLIYACLISLSMFGYLQACNDIGKLSIDEYAALEQRLLKLEEHLEPLSRIAKENPARFTKQQLEKALFPKLCANYLRHYFSLVKPDGNFVAGEGVPGPSILDIQQKVTDADHARLIRENGDYKECITRLDAFLSKADQSVTSAHAAPAAVHDAQHLTSSVEAKMASVRDAMRKMDLMLHDFAGIAKISKQEHAAAAKPDLLESQISVGTDIIRACMEQVSRLTQNLVEKGRQLSREKLGVVFYDAKSKAHLRTI